MIVYSEDLTLAKWKDRFFAWVIDFVIVSIGVGISVAVVHSFGYFLESEWWVTTSAVFLVYWILLEYITGQSLGKRVLNLKTVKEDGTDPSLIDCVLNSFGKAFLLPLDVILGLIFTDKKRQRIFNRLSNTIVIKISKEENEEISYKLD